MCGLVWWNESDKLERKAWILDCTEFVRGWSWRKITFGTFRGTLCVWVLLSVFQWPSGYSVTFCNIGRLIGSSNVTFFSFIPLSTSFSNLLESPSSSSSSPLPCHYSFRTSVILLSYHVSIPFQHIFFHSFKIVCVTPIFPRITAFLTFYSLEVPASNDPEGCAGGSITAGKASMSERF
jgi:hypothetical protein